MLWIYLCLLPIAYGIDIDYYDDTASLRARSRFYDDSNCERWKQKDCKRRCYPEYSACIGDVCYCLVLKMSSRKTDNKEALRHHIAHFCPNIDAAKKCIFKCMKSGKPAFCGKDHVCYCGHRYTPADDEDQYNRTQAYGQFKDLYQKYFGPNYADDYDVV